MTPAPTSRPTTAASVSATTHPTTGSPFPATDIPTTSAPVPIQPTAPVGLARLPKPSLPSFDGSTDWRQFWSRFVLTVDSQPISDTEKLVYLFDCLHGSALELVQGYEFTESSYSLVKKALEVEYGEDGLLITRLCSAFHDHPKSEETILSAHRTSQELNRIVRQLVSLGETVDHSFMESSMMWKLPRFLLERVLREQLEKGLRMTALLEFLTKEINILRQVEEISGCPFPTVALHSAHSQRERGWRNRPFYPCKFCEGSHSTLLCPLDFAHRKSKAVDKKLCFACLRPSHLAPSCPSKQPCRICSSRHHHSALCHPSISSEIVKKPPERKKNLDVVNDRDEDVILLTRDIQVINPRNGTGIRTMVFFDNGAQKSFIREDLAQSLNLTPIDRVWMDINAFGNHRESFKCSVYSVRLLQKDGNLVDLIVYSTPCMDMQFSGVSSKDQESPRPIRRMVSPGILIGSDRFWDFIHSRGPLLPSGLRSIETIFGRMATGTTNPSALDPSPSPSPPTISSSPAGVSSSLSLGRAPLALPRKDTSHNLMTLPTITCPILMVSTTMSSDAPSITSTRPLLPYYSARRSSWPVNIATLSSLASSSLRWFSAQIGSSGNFIPRSILLPQSLTRVSLCFVLIQS